MEYYKLLTFTRPSSTEIAQRMEKILFNSCYDRIASISDFHLYEADSVPVGVESDRGLTGGWTKTCGKNDQ